MRVGPVVLALVLVVGVAGWWVGRPGGSAQRSTESGRAHAAPDASAPSGAPAGRRSADGEQAPGSDPAETESRATPASRPEWFVWNERGVRLLQGGELDPAIEAFERAYAAASSERVVASNLAEALARQARALRDGGGTLAAAIAALERACGLDPERVDLAALLERWRREAEVEAEFSEFLSPYFHLSFDGSRSELLDSSQRFLDRLERSYTDLREWFEHDPIVAGRPPFPVRLYRRAEFERLTGLGHAVAGAFDGTIRLPLHSGDVADEAWRSGLDATLQHELVHAFVREVGGRDVPGWLNEGLAQWLEEGRGAPRAEARLAAARERLAGAPWLPLEELGGPLIAERDPERVRRAYDQSFVLVATIGRDYGEQVLLAMTRAAGDPEQAFERATGVPLDAVLGDLAVR